MSGNYEHLLVEYRNGAAYLGMNRPEARNALNYGLLRELAQAAREADEADEIGAIVIYSAVDGIFCSGADIKERRGMTDAEVKRRRIFARDTYAALEGVNKPLIAAVDGKYLGGGGEIIGSCDILYCSERATFRYVEVAIGSVGATQRVTRLVGRQLANELLFTGRTIDAQEALRIGLVARVFPAEDFLQEVSKWAETIASHPRVTLMASKKAIRAAATCPPEQGVMFEQMAIDLNLAKNDWRSGIDSFKKQAAAGKQAEQKTGG